MIGFVDDSYACVNDFINPIQSPDLLLEQATADAQLWNDLLSSSGGALEIPKCVYHLAHYGFIEAGCPVLQPSPARKTLGCFKTPSSNFKQSLQYIQALAMEKSKLLLHHYVDVKSAYQFYFSIFLLSVTYSSLQTPFRKGLSPPYKTHLSAPSCPEWDSPGIPLMPSCMAPSPSAESAFDRSTTSRDRPRWN
jgi:hypothetical protein